MIGLSGVKKKIKYPVVKDEFYNPKKQINPYCLIDILSNNMKNNDIVITANGTAVVTTHQAFKIKKARGFGLTQGPRQWVMIYLRQLVHAIAVA